MPRGNPQYLIKSEDLTSEQLRKRAVKAGKASVIARKKKKLFKQVAEAILDRKVTKEQIDELKKKGGDLDLIDDSKQGWAYFNCLERAIEKGDSNQFAKLMEMSGRWEPKTGNEPPPPSERPVVNIIMPDSAVKRIKEQQAEKKKKGENDKK